MANRRWDGRDGLADRRPGEPDEHPPRAGARACGRISRLRRTEMRHAIAEMPGHAVWVRQVKKEFGGGDNRTLVLRGVDFDANFGEMTMLVGPSGSGKTTLLSVIAGLLDPTAGDV